MLALELPLWFLVHLITEVVAVTVLLFFLFCIVQSGDYIYIYIYVCMYIFTGIAGCSRFSLLYFQRGYYRSALK